MTHIHICFSLCRVATGCSTLQFSVHAAVYPDRGPLTSMLVCIPDWHLVSANFYLKNNFLQAWGYSLLPKEGCWVPVRSIVCTEFSFIPLFSPGILYEVLHACANDEASLIVSH